jgi:hypothetical protein
MLFFSAYVRLDGAWGSTEIEIWGRLRYKLWQIRTIKFILVTVFIIKFWVVQQITACRLQVS